MQPIGDSKFKWLGRWQFCPIILKMYEINEVQNSRKKQHIYQKLSWNYILNIVIEFQSKVFFKFPVQMCEKLKWNNDSN